MSTKKPSQYTQTEVNMWLNAIGLGSKIPAFQENAVDGSLLVTLTPEDLRGDLGLTPIEIEKFNQAMSFVNSIGGAGGAVGGGGYDGARVMALEQENARLKAEVLDLKEIVKVLQEPSNGRGGNTQSSYATTPAAAAVPVPAPAPTGYQSASSYDPYAAYQTQPNPAPSQSYGYTPAPAPSQSYGYSQAPAPSQSYAAPPAYAPAPVPSQSQHKSQPAGAPVIAGAAGGATKGAILGAIGGAIAGDAGKGAAMGAAMGAAGGGMKGMAARRRQRLGRRY